MSKKIRAFIGYLKVLVNGETLGGGFYRFLSVHACFLVFYGLPHVFINTMLLGQTGDVKVVVMYNATFFLGSAAAMLLAAGLLQRTDSGVTAVLGILGYNVLYLLLIVLGDNASRWHLWLGLLAGLADGCYWLSYGHLLAVWNGGFLQWNGDPMGRDAKDWVSVLEPGAKEWSNPDAVGCDIRYCCHDPVFLKNKKGEIILLFAKFLDTEVNFTTWCNGRDELWTRKTKDGGRTWEPAQPAGIQSGHASNDSVLLDDGTIVFASTSSELPDKYFGAVRIYLSHDDGETWEKGPILSADDGNLIREPALCLRPDGTIRMFTRTCPGSTGWGAGVKSLVSYTAESRDGGKTWTQPVPTTILNNESKIDVISWDKDTILMAYNDTPVADWHERSPLTLAYSKDEGKTWKNLIELAAAPGNKCQPAMCRDRDGRLNVVYMNRHTAIEHLVLEITE